MNQIDKKERDLFELPKPQGISKQIAENIANEHINTNETTQSQAVEQNIHISGQSSSSNSISAPSQPSTISTPVTPITNPQDDISLPAVAADHDLIEKEWVIKAKQIVATTRDDPHARSGRMSKVKSSYVKKRFNKDIELSEA